MAEIAGSPIFDKQPAAAIGALAVAPSQPEHGVGRNGRGLGDSRQRRDGRRNLQVHRCRQDVDEHGAASIGRIGRIVINPTNADIVFACVLGRTTGPQQERGVYRTTDGGKNWERVLFAE